MKEYLIKSGFLKQQRKLILAEDYVEWGNGNFKGREFARWVSMGEHGLYMGVGWEMDG